jgi:multidrug resistance efflux pump
LKKLVSLALALSFTTLSWHLVADRLTPFTSDARVKAFITPLVPEVSGKLTVIEVQNGTIVTSGTVLAKIDPSQFEIARDKATADLQQVLQDIGASSAGIVAAQAEVARAVADLENVRAQTNRVFQLEKDGVSSKAQGDTSRAELAQTESAVDAANAELSRAQAQLGPEGENNPQILRATAELAQAELDLQHTEIKAPARGGVTDISVAPGAYATAGKPILAFVDLGQIWVEAYLTENNIGNVHVGAPVELTLDAYPGRILEGKVASISGIAADSTETTPGSLTAAPRQSGWLRQPQRIPVRIVLPGYEIGDERDDLRFMINGQADVIIYTGEHPLINMLGKALIRVSALLSYAY